jgi:hypothetical protein
MTNRTIYKEKKNGPNPGLTPKTVRNAAIKKLVFPKITWPRDTFVFLLLLEINPQSVIC